MGKNMHEITIWANDSRDAKELADSLKTKGYSVRKVLTAGYTPIINSGARYISGYPKIRSFFKL